jgi:peptidyl-prolyl cis-trans isomerase B (cyclophilin B)
MGTIRIEIFDDIAPNHAKHFDTLVRQGMYDGSIFHRIVPGFVIQGGNIGVMDTVFAEYSNTKFERGIIGAARIGGRPHSATTQFFIMLGRAATLDSQYTAYGKVLEGMEVVDRIAKVKIQNSVPVDDVVMEITPLSSRVSFNSGNHGAIWVGNSQIEVLSDMPSLSLEIYDILGRPVGHFDLSVNPTISLPADLAGLCFAVLRSRGLVIATQGFVR